MTIKIQEYFNLFEATNEYKKLINSSLEKYLSFEYPGVIWEAMKYSVLSDGKRIRPILMLESAKICGGNFDSILPCACALEMLHAQSLIHDDLPCMDNDDFRRGKPTNHKVFGEAVAVLAGDALLSYAPHVIIKHTPESVNKNILLQVLDEFLEASGAMGIVGGQIVDIQSENKEIELETFDYILTHKTGVLFKFAMRAGVLLSGKNDNKILEILTSYGIKIGYAFQIADDILDVTGTLDELGKTPGKDNKSKKNTYVSVHGLENSKEKLKILIDEAQTILIENNINSSLLINIACSIARKVLKC